MPELKQKQQMPVQSREAVYGSKADRKCFGGCGFWEGICGTKTKTANAGTVLVEMAGSKADSNFYRVIGTVEGFAELKIGGQTRWKSIRKSLRRT